MLHTSVQETIIPHENQLTEKQKYKRVYVTYPMAESNWGTLTCLLASVKFFTWAGTDFVARLWMSPCKIFTQH